MKYLYSLVLIIVTPVSVKAADDNWIKQTVYGMDCAPCAYSIEKSISAMSDVENVDVSLNEGIVDIRLKSDAQPNISNIRDAIQRNGFSSKSAEISLIGLLIRLEDEYFLTMGDLRFALIFTETKPTGKLDGWLGREVIISGKISENETDAILVDNLEMKT